MHTDSRDGSKQCQGADSTSHQTRQLTSFPVNLQVEEHHAALPEYRGQQEAYLRFQVTDFLPTLQDYVRRYVPDDLYVASTALNIAFAETAARLTGIVPDPFVRSHATRPTAEQLLPTSTKSDSSATQATASSLTAKQMILICATGTTGCRCRRLRPESELLCPWKRDLCNVYPLRHIRRRRRNDNATVVRAIIGPQS